MRCQAHRFIPYVLVLIALSPDALRGGAARTVQIEQGGPTSLLQALEDASVDHILLAGSYSVAPELPKSLPSPVRLSRNVTLEGPAAADPPVTLDLAFKRAVVMLCETCAVTLRRLVLANARRGSGSVVDFFVGDDAVGTAALLLDRVWRMRLACPPGRDAGDVIGNTPRSKVLPTPQGKQKFAVETVTFQGKTYPDALQLLDVTQDFPLVHQEGAGHATASHSGGYALGSRNVVYLCENFVSEACMAEKSPDACVNELIDSLGQTGGRSSGVPLAAIVAPIVVVGALVAALALWVLHRRRRKQQQLFEVDGVAKLGHPSSGAHSLNSATGGSPWPPGPHDAAAADSVSDIHSVQTTHKSHGGRRSLEVAMQPNGCRQGWKMVSTATAPNLEPAGLGSDSDVVFGDFLGAGSYGRVYRAKWAGRDVACKVIQHDRSTLAAVEAEADLMLSLHHPNVVRAYHYCTFTYAEQSVTSERSRGSRHWSTGGAPLGNQRASVSDSQSSGGSRLRGDSAQGLSSPTGQPLQPSTSASNSGSGSSARVLLLGQQAQEQEGALARQDSSDVLVTNLSLDAAGVQEAATIAGSLMAASSITTKGSRGSGGKTHSAPSDDAGGMVGTGEASALKHKAETWLVQEFCDMGTLTSIAATWDVDDECDEQMLERLRLLLDAAQGLEALHSNHVVHGDINARNILVSSSSASEVHMCAKVADLGLARCLAHHATHRTTNSCGTMSHMAPELLRYGRLSPAVDIYAMGVMMWELYSQGQPAFDKLHYGQFFETVVLRKVRPCVPAGMPPDYELLMRQCWAADPADRPSVSVLRECLQLMVQDRQRRVRAAADVLGAAAGAGASDAGSRDGPAAGVQLGPPGVGVTPQLQALLPAKQWVPSPAGLPVPGGLQQVATGTGAATLSPGNSGTPLSNVSLSALFPETGTPPERDTVLFIGEEAAAAAADAGAGAARPAASSAAAAARQARRPPVASGRPLASAGVANSPSTGDLENQLDKDPSVHNNRNWFV